MKFFIAILALVSLCHVGLSHNLRLPSSTNHGVLTTLEQSSPIAQYKYGDRLPDGQHHRVQREARAGPDNFQDYHYVLRQPEDSEDVRKEKAQFAKIATRNRVLWDFIADSNSRAQMQAYGRANNNNPQPQYNYEATTVTNPHSDLYQQIAAEHAAIGAQRAADRYYP